MRKTSWCMAAMIASLGMVLAQVASAAPYLATEADIQSLGDVTAGFHNPAQLSTIDSITDIPGGIQLDITWRVGQSGDPFGDFFGTNFARVSLAQYTNNESGGLGRLLGPAFDGIQWSISSNQSSFVRPFIQPAPNWTFYESASGTTIPGDLSVQTIVMNFNSAVNYSNILPNTIVHPDVNGEIRANAIGIQFGGPGGLVPGGPGVAGRIIITGVVPEPNTAMLLMMGGLVGLARRRRGA